MVAEGVRGKLSYYAICRLALLPKVDQASRRTTQSFQESQYGCKCQQRSFCRGSTRRYGASHPAGRALSPKLGNKAQKTLLVSSTLFKPPQCGVRSPVPDQTLFLIRPHTAVILRGTEVPVARASRHVSSCGVKDPVPCHSRLCIGSNAVTCVSHGRHRTEFEERTAGGEKCMREDRAVEKSP